MDVKTKRAANLVFMRHWRKTPKGIAANMWTGITVRAGNANGRHPAYADVKLKMTRPQFIAWAIPSIETWLRCHPGVRPTVNRKDPFGHYAVGNIELMAHPLNSKLHAPLTAKRIAFRIKTLCRKSGISLDSVIQQLAAIKEQK